MAHTVFVDGTDISFPCGVDQTVLDAAERAGFGIPYSCRKGICSTCAGVLLEGEMRVRGRGAVAGPDARVLFCQATPSTDVAIVPTRIRRAGIPARKILTARVRSIECPTRDVALISLRFPNGVRAAFDAGQYLRVHLADGSTRNYSMANPPAESDGVQLHVRRIATGKFSEGVLSALTVGAELIVELPFGEIKLDTALESPAILMATGTGFAPFKSMIEEQIRRRTLRPLHLFWGARSEADLYLMTLVMRWRKYPWFRFTPVLSSTAESWSGTTGYVQEAVMKTYPDLSNSEVFACGSASMIETSRESLIATSRLRAAAFYSDAFVPSAI